MKADNRSFEMRLSSLITALIKLVNKLCARIGNETVSKTTIDITEVLIISTQIILATLLSCQFICEYVLNKQHIFVLRK